MTPELKYRWWCLRMRLSCERAKIAAAKHHLGLSFIPQDYEF